MKYSLSAKKTVRLLLAMGMAGGLFSLLASVARGAAPQKLTELQAVSNYLPVIFNGSGDASTYSIAGNVVDNHGTALQGVSITDGAGHATTTDSAGDYTLSGLPSGAYTFTPTLSGYTFAPGSLSISLPPNASGQNFVGTEAATSNDRLVIFEAFLRYT